MGNNNKNKLHLCSILRFSVFFFSFIVFLLTAFFSFCVPFLISSFKCLLHASLFHRRTDLSDKMCYTREVGAQSGNISPRCLVLDFPYVWLMQSDSVQIKWFVSVLTTQTLWLVQKVPRHVTQSTSNSGPGYFCGQW